MQPGHGSPSPGKQFPGRSFPYWVNPSPDVCTWAEPRRLWSAPTCRRFLPGDLHGVPALAGSSTEGGHAEPGRMRNRLKPGLHAFDGDKSPCKSSDKSPHSRAQVVECAGRAQRRRRFGFPSPAGPASQSGVALRLPPHSIGAGLLPQCCVLAKAFMVNGMLARFAGRLDRSPPAPAGSESRRRFCTARVHRRGYRRGFGGSCSSRA